MQVAITVMLFTGVRVDNVQTMRWEDIQEEWWQLRTKGDNPFRIYLVPTVRRALDRLGRREHGPVFSTTVKNKREMVRNRTGVGIFTNHSLRKTLNSRMAACGIDVYTRERVLNHSKKGVNDRTYSVYDHAHDKEHALLKVENHLLNVINRKTEDSATTDEREYKPNTSDRFKIVS
jgi:integrase